MDKFIEDVERMAEALLRKYGESSLRTIDHLRRRLIELHELNKVKINHSIMELVLGAYLSDKGYRVEVEYPLNGDLVADLAAWKSGKLMIIEVETGFTSPENALDPQSYLTARIVSKMARYGSYAERFSLATPLHNILQIPRILLDSRSRSDEALLTLKKLCDRYYSTPAIDLEKLSKIKLYRIYLINVDTQAVKPLRPKTYLERMKGLLPSLNDIKNYLGAGIRSSVAYGRAPSRSFSKGVHAPQPYHAPGLGCRRSGAREPDA